MNQTSYKDWLPLPPDFSVHGAKVDQLIWVTHYLMAVLFIGWGIYFVYCLFHFRQRAGHQATYELAKGKMAKYVEYGVILAEAVLLVALSMPVWASWKNPPVDDKSAIKIHVTGEQFAWNFHYPGPDGIFGKTDPKLINNESNSLGIDPNDPNGKDDIVTLNELHFPVNKPVILEITSKDVIHSFTLNTMRVKQDAIPGMKISIWFQAKERGTGGPYDVSCAQLCGNSHFRMRGQYFIDTPEQYAQWLNDQEKQLHGGTQ
ncbi:MAG: hypothetical protein C5B54_00445 [Acidobacteria bacterium]|nr:MAG: hypothetical protein C5B54_00445 [Acidobacteriota bacterium]